VSVGRPSGQRYSCELLLRDSGQHGPLTWFTPLGVSFSSAFIARLLHRAHTRHL